MRPTPHISKSRSEVTRFGLLACLVLVIAFLASTNASDRPYQSLSYLQGNGAAINVPGVEVDTKFAAIKSWGDLESYLNYAPEDDPLSALSSAGVDEFLDSLVFTELGLASFSANVLTRELTASQIYDLLGLFGLQKIVPALAANARVESVLDQQILSLSDADSGNSAAKCPIIPDTHCTPPATCRFAAGAHCVTCNCGMIPP